MMDKPDRYVYVIGTSPGPFKIGVATRLRDRLSSIQTGSHQKMAVLHSETVPFWDAIPVEQYAHKLLHSFRLSGEWFNVSLDDAKAAVSHAISVILAQSVERDKANAVAKAAKIRAQERQIEREIEAQTIVVPNVELVHKITVDEYFALNDKINKQKNAPLLAAKKAFSQKMIEGKRKKAAKLAGDTAALQQWLSDAAAKKTYTR